MIKFEDYRNDKEFKLETLTYEEIFVSFEEVVNEIRKKYHVEGFRFCPVQLEKEKCYCKMAYGADKNLYPKIRLGMDSCDLLLTPFEVKLLIVDEGVRTIMSPELNEVLFNLMCEKFPDSDYAKKRERYFEDAELMGNQYVWNI